MPAEHVLHSAAISEVMLNFAAERGIARETCLADTGIDPTTLQDPDGLVTPEQEMRLIGNLIEALADVPAVGFELGMQYTASVFGIWGYSLATSRNLKEATELSLRYSPLSTAYCELTTETRDDEFFICADPTGIPAPLRQFLLERDMGTAVNLMREIRLGASSVKRLEFTGEAPAHASRIAELAALQPRYRCRRNALVIPLNEAVQALPQYNEPMARIFEDQCRQLMVDRRIEGISGDVRRQLLGKLGLAANLDDVASSLHLSSRSLRRKLDDEGLSFRGIQDQLREQLASQLLETTTMTLDEMALRLGYRDTASFTRAFRRWKGESPGSYRAR